MEFDITLTATTNDEGGLVASFQRQLDEFGGEATMTAETTPRKVNVGSSWYFEATQTYHVVL